MRFQHLHKRRGYWYYIRRVPDRARPVDPRKWINKTTGIRIADDPRGISAGARAAQLETLLITEWEDRLAGRNPAPAIAFARNVDIAKRYGLSYLAHDEVRQLPAERFYDRLDVIATEPTPEVASAMMGTVSKPPVMLSRLVDEFERINAASLKAKSDNQRKKWRVARDTYVEKFIEVIGRDIELANIDRNHVLDLRDHLCDLAMSDQIKISTANSYIGRIASMFRSVTKVHRLTCKEDFSGLRIAGGEDGVRLAFPKEWVQDTLLAEGALDSLNDEARAIVYLIAECGLRLSEACNLKRHTIVLDHEIPHIRIRPEGCVLKTAPSIRDIPLVGVALMVMRAHPDGFPRYFHKNAQASAVINKSLATHLSLPENRTLYSLRHTFKDRLTDVACLDNVSHRLMGHKLPTPRYGEPSLETKLFWLEKIAFVPPGRI